MVGQLYKFKRDVVRIALGDPNWGRSRRRGQAKRVSGFEAG